MSCTREDLKARLTDALVGEAEPSMREAVFAHAETCPSCREDRARLAAVLGLLKEAPPWKAVAGAGEEGDALSAMQRQRIVASAARSATRRSRGGLAGGAMSWLALAAGLSAVGVALVLARSASIVPPEVEAPVPAAVTSSVHATPVAPEGPMLPRVVSTPVPPPVAPAALRERVPMDVEVSKEAMQEFRKPVESIGPTASNRDVAKARREAPMPEVSAAPAPALAGVAAGATVLPAILQVEGARDPLHESESVVRVVVARAHAAGVACVEFDSMAVTAARLSGTVVGAAAKGEPACSGDRFDVPAGASTGALFTVTARSGPMRGVIGRVSLRDGAREMATRPIDRPDMEGAFDSMSADFRIAYIEARLAEPATGSKSETLRALLRLAEALPDTPRAGDLIARLRSGLRP